MVRRSTRRTAVAEFYNIVKLFINKMSRGDSGILMLVEIRRVYIKSVSVSQKHNSNMFQICFWDELNQLMHKTFIQLTNVWNSWFLATLISDYALKSGIISVVQNVDDGIALDVARITSNGIINYPYWKL
jgi:hypothetical protein